MRTFLLLSALSVVLINSTDSGQAAEPPAKASPDGVKARVGVYDSRAVAYAHFWTDAQQEKRKAAFAEVKAAKEKGDSKKLDELKAAFQEGQRQAHRRVFSTAPVDDVLQEIKDRLPEIQKQAGVSELVSKWDEKKLKPYAASLQVDVTDLLVREFKPTEKHQKVIESIKKVKPISLEEADKCD
jgi:hypothetical protein